MKRNTCDRTDSSVNRVPGLDTLRVQGWSKEILAKAIEGVGGGGMVELYLSTKDLRDE